MGWPKAGGFPRGFYPLIKLTSDVESGDKLQTIQYNPVPPYYIKYAIWTLTFKLAKLISNLRKLSMQVP